MVVATSMQPVAQTTAIGSGEARPIILATTGKPQPAQARCPPDKGSFLCVNCFNVAISLLPYSQIIDLGKFIDFLEVLKDLFKVVQAYFASSQAINVIDHPGLVF